MFCGDSIKIDNIEIMKSLFLCSQGFVRVAFVKILLLLIDGTYIAVEQENSPSTQDTFLQHKSAGLANFALRWLLLKSMVAALDLSEHFVTFLKAVVAALKRLITIMDI